MFIDVADVDEWTFADFLFGGKGANICCISDRDIALRVFTRHNFPQQSGFVSLSFCFETNLACPIFPRVPFKSMPMCQAFEFAENFFAKLSANDIVHEIIN